MRMKQIYFDRKRRMAGTAARRQSSRMTHAPVFSMDIDDRWLAVQRRDRGADGTFVYAVSSTGIFCRPSCPSRRPSRDRVVFFDNATDAERAGHRACKRCRPLEHDTADPWV